MKDGLLRYYVFDLLYLDGKSLLTEPLTKRQALLKKHFPKSELICFNEPFPGDKGVLVKTFMSNIRFLFMRPG